MNSAVSTFPPVVVKDVIDLAKCEVKNALLPFVGNDTDSAHMEIVKFLRQWTAVVKLTLKADRLGNISPSFNLVAPLPDITTATNKFSGLNRTTGLSLNHSETDTSQRIVQFTVDMSQLAKYRCERVAGAQFGPVRYNSEDPDYNLGIRQWIQSVLGADITETVDVGGTAKRMKTTYTGSVVEVVEPLQLEKSRKKWKIEFNQDLLKEASEVQKARSSEKDKEPKDLERQSSGPGLSESIVPAVSAEPTVIPFDSMSYSVTFLVLNGGGFTPGWILRAFKSPGSASGNMFGLQRTDTNTLDITLAPAKPGNGLRVTEQHLHDLLQLNIQRILIPGPSQ